jgi:hypothetical protein
VPLPFPEAGAVTVIQPASVVAVHAHSLVVDTLTLLVPPFSPTF